jgi:hypothetical protein
MKVFRSFLRKWFAKQCKQAWEERHELVECVSSTVTKATRIDSPNGGLTFTVHRADGGHIIETRQYDRKRDENNYNLHIITDEKDLGEEIGKIITFERLRS